MNEYPYAHGDLIATPHTYFFSVAEGYSVVDGYLRSRGATLTSILAATQVRGARSLQLLNWVTDEWAEWNSRRASTPPPESVLVFMKRFAVTKKVWTDYSSEVRPTMEARCTDIISYIEVSHHALNTVAANGDLRFLNICLQATDIVAAHHTEILPVDRSFAASVLCREMSYVLELADCAAACV